MVRSAVTISLVEQARRGPFVFHDDLEGACRAAAELGFDAIELFAPSAEAIRSLPLRTLLQTYGLSLAAVGTGAGMVVHKLSLTDADASRRRQAEEFISALIDAGAEFGAPAIIGSMQGRHDEVVNAAQAVSFLRDAVQRLGQRAASAGTILLYEPLNRYETNMCNTMKQGVELLQPIGTESVRILADLFHMNIEEADIAASLRDAGKWIGHLHFVDSNRQAAGRGHLEYQSIADALRAIHFQGYASAEAFPIPDSLTAARQTIESYRRWFGGSAKS